jgi:hypothetical protein
MAMDLLVAGAIKQIADADSNLRGHVALASGPALDLRLVVLRKKRQSHSSHRKGMTESLAMQDSRNPRILDR